MDSQWIMEQTGTDCHNVVRDIAGFKRYRKAIWITAGQVDIQGVKAKPVIVAKCPLARSQCTQRTGNQCNTV